MKQSMTRAEYFIGTKSMLNTSAYEESKSSVKILNEYWKVIKTMFFNNKISITQLIKIILSMSQKGEQ